MKEIDIRDAKAIKGIQKMLLDGQVIAFLNPETLKIFNGKIKVHPNLVFLEVDHIEKGKIVFSKNTFNDFANNIFSQLSSKL